MTKAEIDWGKRRLLGTMFGTKTTLNENSKKQKF